MQEKILKSINDGIRAVETLKTNEGIEFIAKTADMIATCMKKGGKVIVAGNGGSLCDAMHFAEEFTGFFHKKRKALPAICLSDPGHMSCTANDVGFEWVFQRGVEAYGKKGDVFVALTTSGNSPNLINAIIQAEKMEVSTVAFLGKTGGPIKGMCDIEWMVEGFKTSERIQEAHMTAIHIIIEMVEHKLFDEIDIASSIKKKAALISS
jgi:D-sedoheptulose 7-phosphate isomerase